jgi:hypothetical protein
LGEEPNDPIEFPYELMTGSGLDDNFWLCKISTSQAYVIIYNAVEAGSEDAGFDWTSCTAAYIYMVPVIPGSWSM